MSAEPQGGATPAPEAETRTIAVKALARVEGEGALYVRTRGAVVEDVRLRIYEPPRFFEAFLRGRSWLEPPDITARICGICPVAYQMSAVHALEDLAGVQVEGQLRALRRLLYCGEWIESHALHMFLLHAPDFLGYPDAIRMAADHPQVVQDALSVKKAGNSIVALLGGREVHPINVRVGGFYRVPSRGELAALEEPLARARDLARAAVALTATFPFPELERDYLYVSLRRPGEYPMNEGRIVSSEGLDIPAARFEEEFREVHVEHSNALQAHHRGRHYLVGPLARISLNFEALTPLARAAAEAAGLRPPVRNPFLAIVVRAVEVLHALDEALAIIAAYVPPAEPSVPVTPRAGTGRAATEAPRGLLYHRYTTDAAGTITAATIVPPTSQNQPSIEDDLRGLVERSLALDQATLTHRCEQAVRNHDPCISCATHFLRLELDRR